MARASVTHAAPPKRADAQRNVEAIIAAALRCLARDPDASVASIAAEAGVGRVTLYGHFDSRASLIAAVVERAMEQTGHDLESLDLSGDPRAALLRLMSVTWDLTHRFGALVVAGQRALPSDCVHKLHEEPARRVQRLLRAGRKAGYFRTDEPLAWQVTVVQSLLHGASDAVYRHEMRPDQAKALVGPTVLAAIENRAD